MPKKMIFRSREVSDKQHNFMKAIMRRLDMSPVMLRSHCMKRFGQEYEELTSMQVSSLISEMSDWERFPSSSLPAQGEHDGRT